MTLETPISVIDTETASVSLLGLGDQVTYISHSKQANEIFMLLASQALGEPVSDHLCRWHPSDGDPSCLRFLPNPVIVNIDMSKLRIERRILLVNECNRALIVAVDGDGVG